MLGMAKCAIKCTICKMNFAAPFL
uniref:Uncharacterized protein n=1 Tax=Arundo donax TaxID=35708 RepID=A0A0A9C8V3_ARUDO